MPRVSRIPVEKKIYKDIVDSFVGLVTDLNNKDKVKEFLNDFLTEEERLMLSKRLVLALMIRQGHSTNDIQDALKVSRTTINLMRRWISYKKGIEVGLNKMSKVEYGNKSSKESEGILRHIPPLTRSKKDKSKWLSR